MKKTLYIIISLLLLSSCINQGGEEINKVNPTQEVNSFSGNIDLEGVADLEQSESSSEVSSGINFNH